MAASPQRATRPERERPLVIAPLFSTGLTCPMAVTMVARHGEPDPQRISPRRGSGFFRRLAAACRGGADRDHRWRRHVVGGRQPSGGAGGFRGRAGRRFASVYVV